jgi:hypothetical protein
MVIMKKIIYILSAVILMAACDRMGNNDNELTPEQRICGEWCCTDLPSGGSIYLSLSENKMFELYQQISEGRHRLYRGTWKLEENILMGKYNDGEDWASSYEVTIDNNSLTLISTDESAQKSVYQKVRIPDSVKTGSIVIVKSGQGLD